MTDLARDAFTAIDAELYASTLSMSKRTELLRYLYDTQVKLREKFCKDETLLQDLIMDVAKHPISHD